MSQYKVCNFGRRFLQLKILVPMFVVAPAIYACNVESSARESSVPYEESQET